MVRRMPKLIPILALLLLAGLYPAAAAGASPTAPGDWQDHGGARLRLVTAPAPEPDGTLRAALHIDLAPGWKTYWRDPGDSGVPPTVTVAGVSEAPELFFPAPRRFEDDYGGFVGYDRPVMLALVIPNAGEALEPFVADVFLGICETVCIPVQGRLAVGGRSVDADAVDAAFAALPGAGRSDFEARTVSADETTLHVEADLPAGVDEAELFVAGSQKIAVAGLPVVHWQDGALTFAIPIARYAPGDGWLHYTLVAPDGEAVAGMLAMPY